MTGHPIPAIDRNTLQAVIGGQMRPTTARRDGVREPNWFEDALNEAASRDPNGYVDHLRIGDSICTGYRPGVMRCDYRPPAQ
jgi:hypothetical protein